MSFKTARNWGIRAHAIAKLAADDPRSPMRNPKQGNSADAAQAQLALPQWRGRPMRGAGHLRVRVANSLTGSPGFLVSHEMNIDYVTGIVGRTQ